MHMDVGTILASDRNTNESATGYGKSSAWVIDGYGGGAFPGPPGVWDSWAQWYSRTLGRFLEDSMEGGKKTLKERIKTAVARTGERYRAETKAGQGPPEKSDGPFAGISLIRVEGHAAEYFLLGYPEIIVSADGDIQVFRDGRTDRIGSEMESAGTDPEADDGNTTYRNRQNGFWELDFSGTPVEHGRTGKFPICDGMQILLLSKGASQALSPFRIYEDPEYLMSDAKSRGLEHVWNMIRHYEAGDPERRKFRRTRSCENVAAALLEIRADGEEGKNQGGAWNE